MLRDVELWADLHPASADWLTADGQNKRGTAHGPARETKCKGEMHNFKIPNGITGLYANPFIEVTYNGFAVPHDQESSLAVARSIIAQQSAQRSDEKAAVRGLSTALTATYDNSPLF